MVLEIENDSFAPVHVCRSIPRVGPELVEAFRDISSATVHEARGKRGALDATVRTLDRAGRNCGPAATALCLAGDNLMIHKALTLTEPGEVLVVAVAGGKNYGSWGDLPTTQAPARACRAGRRRLRPGQRRECRSRISSLLCRAIHSGDKQGWARSSQAPARVRRPTGLAGRSHPGRC